MTETSIAQNAIILVATDIAKARHEVLIAIPGKKRRRRLTVVNGGVKFGHCGGAKVGQFGASALERAALI